MCTFADNDFDIFSLSTINDRRTHPESIIDRNGGNAVDGRKITLTFGLIYTGTAPTTGSGPAAPSKRREQVRHAQRYVLSLNFPICLPFFFLFLCLSVTYFFAITSTNTYSCVMQHPSSTDAELHQNS